MMSTPSPSVRLCLTLAVTRLILAPFLFQTVFKLIDSIDFLNPSSCSARLCAVAQPAVAPVMCAEENQGSLLSERHRSTSFGSTSFCVCSADRQRRRLGLSKIDLDFLFSAALVVKDDDPGFEDSCWAGEIRCPMTDVKVALRSTLKTCLSAALVVKDDDLGFEDDVLGAYELPLDDVNAEFMRKPREEITMTVQLVEADSAGFVSDMKAFSRAVRRCCH